LAAVAATGALCDPPARATEISRERAIEIALAEVTDIPNEFNGNIAAVLVASRGVSVWRVTFTFRLPEQPPQLFETRIVEIDANTGKAVGASIN
jgi:hypothetical protein